MMYILSILDKLKLIKGLMESLLTLFEQLLYLYGLYLKYLNHFDMPTFK